MEDFFGPTRTIEELSPKDFDPVATWRITRRGRPVTGVVIFFAPWCGHCQRGKETWRAASTIVGFCDFFAFDCEKHKRHVEKMREDSPALVRGYPTLVFYENGSPLEVYEGEPSVEGLVEFCANGGGRTKGTSTLSFVTNDLDEVLRNGGISEARMRPSPKDVKGYELVFSSGVVVRNPDCRVGAEEVSFPSFLDLEDLVEVVYENEEMRDNLSEPLPGGVKECIRRQKGYSTASQTCRRTPTSPRS